MKPRISNSQHSKAPRNHVKLKHIIHILSFSRIIHILLLNENSCSHIPECYHLWPPMLQFKNNDLVFTAKSARANPVLWCNESSRINANLIFSNICFGKIVETIRHFSEKFWGQKENQSFFVLFCFVLIWSCCAACRILAPQPGIEPRLRQWKRRVLTTGLPGNSQRKPELKDNKCVIFVVTSEIICKPSISFMKSLK